MAQREKNLTGKQKAAALLISLGPDHSAEIFKHLTEEEIEDITLEIAHLQQISPEVKENILDEFHQMCIASEYISQGGVEYARQVLEKALGTQKAEDIIERLTASLQVRPFDSVRKADPAQLLNFIQNEHPQTIALIMAHLDSDKSSAILSSLSPENQTEVAKRIATMDRTSPEVLKEVEKVLEQKLASFLTEDYTTAGGIASIVDILNLVDRGTERNIIEELEQDDPELAEEIRKRMFVFEDIVLLDDRSIRRVLQEIDTDDLALALKSVSDEVSNKIFNNMSNRAGEMLREDIEYLGPVRLRDIEEAQQKIVNVIRRLEDEGEVIIARGGEDEIIV